MKDGAQWKHDQDISFIGARAHLQSLADALRQVIDEEKKKLSHMIGTRDAFKVKSETRE